MNIFTDIEEKCIFYIFSHVNDILMEYPSTQDIDKLNKTLNGEFDMKYLGDSNWVLRIDITRH